jgi:hypothetical protein
VQGSGTINTNPMAMAASASISTNGVSGLQVGVRVDPTTVWEVGYTDNGLTPDANDARVCRTCRGNARSEGGRGRHDGHGQPDRVPRPRPTGSDGRNRSGCGDGRRGGGDAVPIGDRPRLSGYGSRHQLRGTERDQFGNPDLVIAGLSHHQRPGLD